MVVPDRSVMDFSFSDLRYAGIPIHPSAVCAQNGLHSYLYHVGVRDRVLITFSTPLRLFRARDVGSMGFSGAPLDTWMARAQYKYLDELGVPLPVDALQRYRQALANSYLLGSSLCVVQKKTDQGLVYDFVTKNPLILGMYRDRMVARDQVKDFKRQLSFHSSELLSNAFESVRLLWDHNSVLHAERYRVGSRSKGYIFPYYAVENYAGRLLHELGNRTVRLSYLDAQGQECSLVTTYNTGAVANWRGSTLSDAVIKKWADWRRGETLGYISLPDLQQPGHFVSVPVLRITRVVTVSG